MADVAPPPFEYETLVCGPGPESDFEAGRHSRHRLLKQECGHFTDAR
jgi:hypothetical protein